MTEPILYLDSVSVTFDGFRALNKLSLIVEPGELRAVIGPNGAGKTTMMDVITGKTRADEGTVLFNGDIDLTRLDEVRISELGIGRKFQRPSVFANLTVLQNLELALAGGRGAWQALIWNPSIDSCRRIDEVLETINLGTHKDHIAASLSHGQKQWLEIGMLLAQEPLLLLVDEPVAGMTDAETEDTARLLKSISGQRSVLVVEHDMTFVEALDAKVTVLHEGSVLAEGRLAQVSTDSRVIEVYLGR